MTQRELTCHFNTEWETSQEELVSGSQHFEEPYTPPAMLVATWQLFQQL